jgi:hypothetical protein
MIAHALHAGGVVHPTFKDAALALHLLDDDQEWERCLAEMSLVQTGRQLRQLFALLLLHGNPAIPERLWEAHQESLTEDILHAAREHARDPSLSLAQEHIDAGLRHVEGYQISHSNKTLADYPNMRIPPPSANVSEEPHIIAEQLAYDREALAEQVESQRPLLNPEQRAFFEQVRLLLCPLHNNTCTCSTTVPPVSDAHSMAALEEARHDVQPTNLFLYSPGGCGKTFLLNLILAAVRAEGEIALATATSGVAALLLDGELSPASHMALAPITDASFPVIR